MKKIPLLLLGLLMLGAITHSCMSDPVEYPDNKLYNNTTDTASLVIKVTNINKLAVKADKTEMQLLMFDSESLFLSQQTIPAITTKDTSFVLKGLPMGHYSLMLLSKASGLENLNYLEDGIHTYQNVTDTLQYLLASGFLAVQEKVILNNPINTTTINWQNTTSLISQVKFDVRLLQNETIWKTPIVTAQLYLLVFQNGTLCNQRILSEKDILNMQQDGSFVHPIAKGANYTFMIVDLNDYTDIGNVANKLKSKKTTMDSIQIMLQTKIEEIRMAYKPQLQNLTKAEETVTMGNAIQSINVKLEGTTTPSWTTDAEDWSLMIFDGSEYLKRVITKEGKITTADLWKMNVFKDATYTLLVVGNAQNAVAEFQAMTIKAQYVLDNLQDKQTNGTSWLGYGTGKITQLVLSNSYTLTPEKRLKFSALPILSIKEAKAKKTLNYFANNPTRITGIVTNNGQTTKIGEALSGLDNPISNVVILQDLSSVTDGEAMLIEFKNAPTDLNIGDQITVALQDGEFTTTNTNASNMSVFQKVTYTRVGEKTTDIDLPAKTLSLSDLTPTNYQKYEGLLVQISNDIEFKWFKDIQFNTFPSDKMILRDASVAATTLPSSRKTVNMEIDNKAIPTFAGKLLPTGKGKISGFLVKTKSGGLIAIHPRSVSDVAMNNIITDRVDKGILAVWDIDNVYNKTSIPMGIAPKTDGNYGVGRENAYIKANLTGSSTLTIKTSGTGSPAYEADKGVCLYLNSSTPTSVYETIYVDTKEMATDESLYFSLSGSRGTSAGDPSELVFDVSYIIGTKSSVSLPEQMKVPMTYLGATKRFTYPSSGFTEIKNAGGSSVTITIKYVSGKTGGGTAFGGGNTTNSNNSAYISYQNITFKQQ